jgi:hypothetical protein
VDGGRLEVQIESQWVGGEGLERRKRGLWRFGEVEMRWLKDLVEKAGEDEGFAREVGED